MGTLFIKQLIESKIPANDLIAYLEGILFLRKKYGNKIYHKDMIAYIDTIDTGFTSLLRLLIHYRITHIKDIKALCRTIQLQHPEYTQQFKVFAPKEQYRTPIQQKIQSTFPDSTVTALRNMDVGVEITGEGWHYKRHLDQDIEKLLG